MYDLDEEKHSLCLLLQQSNETKDRTVRNIFSVSIEQKLTFQNKHSAGIYYLIPLKMFLYLFMVKTNIFRLYIIIYLSKAKINNKSFNG
jgi:hypothetical protein